MDYQLFQMERSMEDLAMIENELITGMKEGKIDNEYSVLISVINRVQKRISEQYGIMIITVDDICRKYGIRKD